jgi:hypothetical protein
MATVPLYTPKKVVLNWHQYDVVFSIELIKSFVRGVEQQAADSIRDYRDSKSSGEHRGLDDESWDLQEIFEEYFPSLQRRSALLTIWAFLEHELNALCSLYQSEKGFQLTFSDLSGKGIDRSTAYLEKVAGLHGLKGSPEWNDLKAIQNIRNLIAHNDGRLRDRQVNEDAILTNMKKLVFLSSRHELRIAEGFLSKVVDACDSYFKRIAEAIDASEGAGQVHRR